MSEAELEAEIAGKLKVLGALANRQRMRILIAIRNAGEGGAEKASLETTGLDAHVKHLRLADLVQRVEPTGTGRYHARYLLTETGKQWMDKIFG